VEQSKPRLLQQVRQRMWGQSFLAWLPQSWQLMVPAPALAPLPPPRDDDNPAPAAGSSAKRMMLEEAPP
jgi:hypothetical protein